MILNAVESCRDQENGERGQSSLELLGIISLVVAIVVAIIATGAPEAIGTGAQHAVCRVTGGGCGSSGITSAASSGDRAQPGAPASPDPQSVVGPLPGPPPSPLPPTGLGALASGPNGSGGNGLPPDPGNTQAYQAAAGDRSLPDYIRQLFATYNARHWTAVGVTIATLTPVAAAQGGTVHPTNFTIPNAGRGGGSGFADVVMEVGNTYYIWEVKPDSPYGHRDGPPQLARYVQNFQAQHPGATVVEGFPIPPRGPVPVGNGEFIEVSSGNPAAGEQGLEFYRVIGNRQPQPTPQPVPDPVPVPVPVPGPVPTPVTEPSDQSDHPPGWVAPAAGAGGLAAAAGILWWLAKPASVFCGPALPLCALAF